jgi:hypothetical protein
MIEKYINKLIENLPDESKNKQRLDVVLDGGIFNGSYLVGALYFLKEMERKDYVSIERISGCSVGSIVGFLYFINALDIMPKLYNIVKNEFETKFSLKTLKKIKMYLKNRIPKDVCSLVNDKLFICYNDVKNNKKIVKSRYKNENEIIDTIIKSCYIPFLIDSNVYYKDKYIDGINAYIFKKENDKKILHMELLGYDKFSYSLNIKNERSNFHRILSGLLDIHCFYIKKTSTSMCSYVDDWTLINKLNYSLKLFIERIIVLLFFITYYIKTHFLQEIDINDFLIVKIISKCSFVLFSVILETYFL